VTVPRRAGIVLLVALAAAGCTVRTETVPGQAAPLTATGSPAPTTPTPTPTPSATPTAFRTVTMTGAGLSITFPVPDDWSLDQSRTGELSRTDAAVGAEVLLRVDLTARGSGTARAGAESVEASIKPHRSGYTRLGIADVDGVGDDAVDWSFRYQLAGGTPARVIDRQILSGSGGIAVYLRAPADSWDRYLAVWQRTTRDLSITTS
jgi:eukaryotic-like serine/threonine-protein kinase